MTSQNMETRGNGENWFWTKIAPHTKACWEKSLSLGEALYSFVERSGRFWQLLHNLVCHISKDIGDRDMCGAVFRSIDDLPACFCMGCYLCLEPILLVATLVAALWRSTCKPYVMTARESWDFSVFWKYQPSQSIKLDNPTDGAFLLR